MLFKDLLVSMDLRKRKKKRRILKIPTVSSSKKPSEVRPMWETFKARKKDEKRPTSLPPMSLPKKYMTRHVNVPRITGNNTLNSKRLMGKPSAFVIR